MKEGKVLDEALACLGRFEAAIDDLHRVRVWAGIEAKLKGGRGRSGTWKLYAAFACGAAAVALVMTMAWPAGRPHVDGRPGVPHRAALPQVAPMDAPAAIAAYLVSGTAPIELLDGKRRRLELPAGGVVRAMIADAARITLVGPAVLAVVANDAQSLRMDLDRGLLLCDFEHRSSQELRIRSPQAETVVVGTLFAVEAVAGGTRVSVAHGQVSVVREGRRLLVGAGQALANDNATPVPMAGATAQALAEHDATVRPASGSSGVLSITTDGDLGAAWLGNRLLGTPPLAARLSSGPTQVLLGPEPGEARTYGRHVRRIDTLVLPGKTTLAVAESRIAAAPSHEKPTPRLDGKEPMPESAAGTRGSRATDPSSGRSPAALYSEAEEEMRKGDLANARHLLQSLVERYPEEGVASTARYELARLAFAGGDWEEARQQLESLGQGWVAPALAEPVHYLRCRIEVASKQRGAAVICLKAFRKQFPESPHGAEVLALLASFHLEDGCQSAVPYLDEYLRRYPHGSFAVDAEARRAACGR